jgi:outer membrane protein assembly factor BamB
MLIPTVLIVLAGPLAAVPISAASAVPSPAAALPQDSTAQVGSLEPIWTTPLGQFRQTSVLRAGVVGDVLLVEDGLHGISALELPDGHPRWFVQLEGALDHWPTAGAGTVALASGTNTVVVELSTGRRLFDHGSAALPAGAPVSDGRLVYVPSLLNDTLVAIDTANGMQAWEYRLPARFASGAQLIGSEGRASVLFASDDGKLRALPAGVDVPDRERWVRHVGALVAPPVQAGNRIYLTTVGREVIALDASSGEIEWKHLPGESITGSAVVVGDGIAVATESRVIMLSADDGRARWERAAAGTVTGEAGGALLWRDESGRSVLLDGETGESVWVRVPMGAKSGGGLVVAVQRGSVVSAWRVVR